MNKSVNELGAENVLATKSLDKKKQTESASENEESDTVTEQSSSSSSSETTNTQNSLSNTSKSTISKRKSNSTSTKSFITTVTQFSVQRSDVDGLRMKISAIRPTTVTKNISNNTKQPKQTQVSATAASSETAAISQQHCEDSSQESCGKVKTQTQTKSMHYNNNCLTKPLTVKLSNIKLQQKTVHLSKLATREETTTTKPNCLKVQAEQVEACFGANDDCGDGVDVSKSMPLDVAVQKDSSADSGIVGAISCADKRHVEANASVSTTDTRQSQIISTLQEALPLTLPLLSQTTCYSDATAESGCSEATTTTITGGKSSLARRVRVKRKKTQSKLAQEHKKPTISAADVLRSRQTQQLHNLMTYTSDSEDETSSPQQQQQLQLQKRAPRLLLTAINTNVSTNEQPIKPLALSSSLTALTAGTATFSHGSDNSDNEQLKLDDVVNAVIKCVESDGDDTPTGTDMQRKSRSKRPPQYQSTLLQDFMEKTQMLGSNSSGASVTATVAAITTKTHQQKSDDLIDSVEKLVGPNRKVTESRLITNAQSAANTPTESVAQSATVVSGVKKKRGRPKKSMVSNTIKDKKSPITDKILCAPTSVIMSSSASVSILTSNSRGLNINESADSGVISTASTTTTQSSTSPSPKLTCAMSSSNVNSSSTGAHNSTTTTTPSQKRRYRTLEPTENAARQPSISPTKSQTQDGGSSSGRSTKSPKPKIDIAYLDKRMYAATERLLYPPPRNKRRQSVGAPNVSLPTTPSTKSVGKTHAAATPSSSTALAAAAAVANVTPTTTKGITKEELQLDPVWRKIDVNKKFRRPSLSGYKSDGGGGNTTICSKILAAKSGYVSDYGSFHARATRDHSGYKSDASGKSRYSMKSCLSRRSRAKSCGYRSDCKDGKDGVGASLKSSKYRRKRRAAALLRAHSKSVGNLAITTNDAEKDILQLAGLSLGQSSEESNEYVCKPNLESLPTTSASKKYGEINRFIATGEYFGRGSSGANNAITSSGGENLFPSHLQDTTDGGGSQDGYGFSRKLLLQRNNATVAAGGGTAGIVNVTAHEAALLSNPHLSRKIKSRRSSVASYCSSYYSGTSKVRKRHRRKSFLRFPCSGKTGVIIDSKLLTEIDILANTFSTRCRIQSGGSKSHAGSSSSSSYRDKMLIESGTIGSGNVGGKLQSSNSTTFATTTTLNANTITGSSSKREQRDKRSLKKRKMSENQEYALMSGIAGVGSNVGGFGGAMLSSVGGGSGAKRRHKKANSSSSPDDHKLPLKKRHYLLTPGEKSTEAAAAAAVAAKLFGSTAVEAWAAAVASTKLATGAGRVQYHHQQFGALCGNSATLSGAGSTHSGSTKSSKTGLTPKKRQFPQNQDDGNRGGSGGGGGLCEPIGNIPKCGSSYQSNSSPLRITIDNTLSHKLLDISPISLTGSSTTKQTDVHRKRSRLEVLVSKIVATSSNSQGPGSSGGVASDEKDYSNSSSLLPKQKQSQASSANIHHHQQRPQQSAETPPPGIFEPSVALEIQIPPIGGARLNEASASAGGGVSIVTKAEVNSPLMLQEMTPPSVAATATAKTECVTASTRVVETLLNKTSTANLLLKRKRKKINRTGFPNVRKRKKNKISDQLLLNIVEGEVENISAPPSPMKRRSRGLLLSKQQATETSEQPNNDAGDEDGRRGDEATSASTITSSTTNTTPAPTLVASTPEKESPCDRVPVSGEASDSFLERANRTPRLSVVALERLRGTPTPSTAAANVTSAIKVGGGNAATAADEIIEAHKENSFITRKGRVGRKPKGKPLPPTSTTKKGVSASTHVTKMNANIEPMPRKSRLNTIPSTSIQTRESSSTVDTTMPTTPKSSRRARATEATAAVAQTPPKLVVDYKQIQPLTVTNNTLPPRARGRKPKLSANALAAKTPSPSQQTVASIAAQENKNKSTSRANVTQMIQKFPNSSTLAKQTRKGSTGTNTSTTTTPTSNNLKSLDRPASFSKSTVHKIITAKSLEAKVKLPAGIDPNTNFSCKIRLKRPSTKKTLLGNNLRQSTDSNNGGGGDGNSIKDLPQSTPEQIATESAAKDSNITYLEQDILPRRSETPFIDSEATTSDTSDEKSSTISSNIGVASVTRKVTRLKKNYLTAGLFSNYFKESQTRVMGKRAAEKREAAAAQALALAANTLSTSSATRFDRIDATIQNENNNSVDNLSTTILHPTTPCLPPPPYCESYYRRTQIDFQLPYDIWWAYTNSKLPTRITVPSWNFRKIRTNIYADAVRPNLAGLDHPTCNCKPEQGCGDNCLNRMVYTECSPSTCPARDKCRNQKIQRHEIAPGVERFMTTDKGWGVRTKLPIIKGTYILEYVGEVVTEREFKDRMGTIYLNDTHHYCLHLDGGLVIDGHRMGSDCRFVNHSCQPNCEMQKWSVNGLSRMALFAKRYIEPGEELSYDYNFSLFNPSEGQPCRCNTPQCRGVIGGKSQRIKPLPIDSKSTDQPSNDGRSGRPRKRLARKNTERVQSKDVVVSHGQQLSEKEKKFVKQHGIFLVRNFENIRRCKAKRRASAAAAEIKMNGLPMTALPTPTTNILPLTNIQSPGKIMTRRSSTPASLVGQLSTIRSPRIIKMRGLTQAVQVAEVEKMAKIAVILRDICTSLELLKDPKDNKQTLAAVALTNNNNSTGCLVKRLDGENGSTSSNCGVGRKKKTTKTPVKPETFDFKTVQSHVEQGYYKLPSEFNADMQKIFETARPQAPNGSRQEAALLELITAYENKKREAYVRLLDVVGGDETVLTGFTDQATLAKEKHKLETNLNILQDPKTVDTNITIITPTCNEDIIRCICGLHKDEGLMIQCARCMVWQHTECTKADINADNYLCERCEPRFVDREIPLDDFTEEGHRYYLTLLRGDLHIRQGDAVYVLRDIPIKDSFGNVLPKQKHTYETIGNIDYNECDIFRVERLWKNEEGKRFIFGHHFLRPHETFHEPSRRFYPNEVVRVPLYEVIPIELVIGRCFVLDRTTFCKGRPVECTDEAHCYICELRVDKTARFFSKAKVNYPTCTKTYAFRKFPERLKISKSYAPHDVDPSLLKPKRQKTDLEISPNTKTSGNLPLLASITASADSSTSLIPASKPNGGRKRRNSCFPATVHVFTAIPPSQQTMKRKRTHLETVLNTMKLKWKNNQADGTEQPIDLSYLLSGRSARQRKTHTTFCCGNTTTAATSVTATTTGGMSI